MDKDNGGGEGLNMEEAVGMTRRVMGENRDNCN